MREKSEKWVSTLEILHMHSAILREEACFLQGRSCKSDSDEINQSK